MRKIFIPLIVILVVAISAFFIFRKSSNEEEYKVSIKESSVEETLQDLKKNPNKDTDGDGLKDWQEALWQTDKENPDTDGDGKADGEEVSAGTNPLLKGPGDELDITDSTEEESLTSTFSKDLFAQYLYAKNEGVEFGSNTEEILAQSALNSDYLATPTKQYESSDLNINFENGDVENYAEDMGLIIRNHILEAEQNEQNILSSYAQSGNIEFLGQLGPAIQNYKSLSKISVGLEIPVETAQIHLEFINSLEEIISGLETLRQAQSDPILGAVGLSIYSQGSFRASLANALAQKFYTLRNISFEQGSNGYLYLYGL